MPKQNILFCINMKLPGRERHTSVYKYAIDTWQRWGKKHNAQVIQLDKPIYDFEFMRPNWMKWHLFDLLENENIEYDQICIFDADTIIKDDAPNFFELTDRKFTGVQNIGSYDWMFRSIEVYSKEVFDNKMFEWERYINTGFMIVNEIHKPFFKNVLKFYKEHQEQLVKIQNTYYLGTEQTPVNALLQQENIEMTFLGYEWNMQDLNRKELLGPEHPDGTPWFWDFGYVAHFNAVPEPGAEHWIMKTYRNLYGNSEL